MKQLSLFPEKFCRYDKENPHIYDAFKQYTLQTIEKNYKHYSSKVIFEIIRWHSNITGNDGFKMNNNYTAFYARKFEDEYPQYKGFFFKRNSKFDNQ